MICHQHKCIFVHIPAAAGTSIEEWIIGTDWWNVEPRTKHLLASQARREYAEYWDDYFKFAIIRDPVTSMKSRLRFPEFSFLELEETGKINLDGYRTRFERDNKILEYDWRFYDREDVIRPQHKSHSLYGNVLDEELDYIGYFEHLGEVTDHLRDTLKIDRPFSQHAQQSTDTLKGYQMPEATRRDIQTLFRRDYALFDFDADLLASGDVFQEESEKSKLGDPSMSEHARAILQLQEKITDLTYYRDGYRKSLYEIKEKNKVIVSLQAAMEDFTAAHCTSEKQSWWQRIFR